MVGGNVVVVVDSVVEGCASNSESPDLLHPAINTTATSSPAIVLIPHVTSRANRTARRASRLLSGDVRVCHPRGCLEKSVRPDQFRRCSTTEACAIPIQGPDALYLVRQHRHRLLLDQFEPEPLGYRLRPVVVDRDATEESFLSMFLEPVADCGRPRLSRAGVWSDLAWSPAGDDAQR